MRKIEEAMNKAVHYGRTWSSSNTSTQLCTKEAALLRGYGQGVKVKLHGNHIATVWTAYMGRDIWLVEVNVATLAYYPTRTTMSRLRALGADVCTKKGQVILDGVEICPAQSLPY